MDLTYTWNTPCAIGCGFCPFQRAERPPLAEHVARIRALADAHPFARRLFVVGGDLLADPQAPKALAALRDAPGLPEVYWYTPLRDPARITALRARGPLDGVLLPLFHWQARRAPWAPPPALVLKAAADLRAQGVKVIPLLFALPENLAALDRFGAHVQRALDADTVFVRVMNVLIRDDRALPFSSCTPALTRLAAVARARGFALRVIGDEYPPPCAGDLGRSSPEIYENVLGASPRAEANTALPACTTCALTTRCRWGYQPYLERFGVDEFAPLPRQGRPGRRVEAFEPEQPAGVTEVDWQVARADIEVPCTRPWTTLELLCLEPAMAGPCNEDWLKRDLEPLAGGCLLGAWNGPYFQTMRRHLAAGDADAVCRDHCSERSRAEGEPLPEETWPIEGRAEVFLINRLRQVQEILAGALTLRSRPTRLSFGPTGRCNHSCAMCHNLDDRRRGVRPELDEAFYHQVEELLPTLADLQVSGPGEPFVSQAFRAFVEAIDHRRFPDLGLTITTNGALLDAHQVERLRRVPLKRVIWSLNAATEATHEAVSGVRDWARVRANLDGLLARGGDFGAGPPALQLSFVVQRRNLDDLGAFLDLAAALDCGVRLTAMEPDNFNASESLATDPGQAARAQRVLTDLERRWRKHARVVQYLRSVTRTLERQSASGHVKRMDR